MCPCIASSAQMSVGYLSHSNLADFHGRLKLQVVWSFCLNFQFLHQDLLCDVLVGNSPFDLLREKNRFRVAP